MGQDCFTGQRRTTTLQSLLSASQYVPILYALCCVYPIVAQAADECGPSDGSGTVHCTGPDYSTATDSAAIQYSPTTDLTLIVGSSADPTISVTPPADKGGVFVHGPDTGTVNVTIDAANTNVATKGVPGDGILIDQKASGNLTIQTDNVNISTGHSETSPSDAVSTGITASLSDAASTGNISITTHAGSITTTGNQSYGIYGVHWGQGDIDISTSSQIKTSGEYADGVIAWIIDPSSTGSATIRQISGDITTSGIDAIGLDIINYGTGDAVASSAGTINVSGVRSIGVAAVSANDTTVSVDGDIAATGQFGAGVIATSTAGATVVNISPGSTVMGGWQSSPGSSGHRFDAPSAGVVLGGATASLTNYGNIGALSDRAIAAPNAYTPASGDITIDNYGTITGYLSMPGTGHSTFNNYSSNSFVMRHFADTDGDGVRDTKAVAISDFGGPASVFNNTATGKVRFATVATAATTDATGYYQPKTGVDDRTLDPGFYDLNRNGVVQGQFVNLSTFNNAGVIDLRGPAPGNTLLITDQPTASSGAGAGTFVSNGGRLLLNAPLQSGLAAGGTTGSESDMLIVDRTLLGTGATQISVSKAPTSLGALTTGNGIELVEVRDAAHSADGAFALGHRVAAGAYEYVLYKGGTGPDAADGNWYLRSFAKAAPDAPTVPNYRPEVPLNMAIPALANRVGLSMLGTYHDRQGQDSLVSFGSGNQANKSHSTWSRIIAEHGSTKYGSGDIHHFENYGPSYDFTLSGFQVGADAYRKESKNGKNFDQAGPYFGVAYIDADVDDYSGSRAGTARLTGYSLGGYWTRITESGAYIDAVGQLTYYADASTRSLVGESSETDGWGGTASIEGGYPIALGGNWSLEPQAQLIVQYLKLDDTADSYGLIKSSEATTVTGRVGARLVKHWQTRSGLPVIVWARANVWQTFDSNVDTRFSNLNGEHPVELQTALGNTVGQIGLGISGKVSKNTYLFATANYARALSQDSGKTIAGQIGVKFRW